MITIRFNSEMEFRAEIERDRAMVDCDMLRVTLQTEQSRQYPVLRHVSVVATAMIRAGDSYRRVVRLDRYCGTAVENGDEAVVMSKQIRDSLMSWAEEQRLEVRAGIIEPPA